MCNTGTEGIGRLKEQQSKCATNVNKLHIKLVEPEGYTASFMAVLFMSLLIHIYYFIIYMQFNNKYFKRDNEDENNILKYFEVTE